MADIGLKQLAELESGSPTTLTSVEAANRSTIIFILASASTIASKTPILFLYIRLFGSERWLRVCSYATLVSSAVILGAGVIAVGAVCIRRHEGAVAETRCRNYWDRAWVACGSTSLGADLVVLALPLPIIAKLRLPTRKKLGLALVFASGIFAIAATTVALYYKIEASLNGVMVAWAVGMTWSNVEWCISVMVGCVPSVYTFWSTVVTKSKFYMKVSKTFSDISCSFSRSQCSRGRPRTLDDESTRRITEREPSNGGGSIEMTRTNTNGGFAV
ncbi:hypothetical protein GGR53DRAFT_51104 [Hypoxylon sp. FL1150]|nr:hypothetical protein GGR53DRAFT_51104 [Hypoxylon sp. FL1150]